MKPLPLGDCTAQLDMFQHILKSRCPMETANHTLAIHYHQKLCKGRVIYFTAHPELEEASVHLRECMAYTVTTLESRL